MDKPISVSRQELKQCTVENINRSGLPLFLVVDLFEEMLRELKPLSKQQIEEELQRWNESIAQQKEGDDA